jgi:hypothetical protein
VNLSLRGYVDTDLEKSRVDQKNIFRCSLILNFVMISVVIFVALSTTEAEYISLSVRSIVAS